MAKKTSNLSGKRSGNFKIRQARHYQALVEVAFHALLRMTTGRDPEAVHDLRVSLRSQRVLLALFPHSKKINEARKRLGQAAALTGHVRDLEVALALAESLEAESGQGKKLVQAMAAELAKCQTELLQQLHAADLDDGLEEAESAWLSAILRRRRKVLQCRTRDQARKLGKTLGSQAKRLDQSPTLEQWHNVRLAGKRLRYWVEGFSELLTHKQRRRVQWLRALQQSLGSLHDLEMFEERFKDKSMPPKWRKLFDAQQELVRHRASSSLAELRANW